MRLTRWALVSICALLLLAGHAGARSHHVVLLKALHAPSPQLIGRRSPPPSYARRRAPHGTARNASSSAHCSAREVFHCIGQDAPYAVALLPPRMRSRAPPAIAGSATKRARHRGGSDSLNTRR